MYLGDNIHQKIPALFNKMQYLISKGYHGVELNKETKTLIWQKDENVKKLYNAFDVFKYNKLQKTGTL